MTIFLTGASGFVGRNFISYFNNSYKIRAHQRDSNFSINEEIVVHLAGKAHDLKRTANSEDYYEINTELTKDVFDSFLKSNAKVFIILSSVKAVADFVEGVLTEDHLPNPKTHYGKSKLLAEKYISSKINTKNKRIYILRPCMIHGPGNKGNLNLLYKLVSMGFPWLLGDFDNQRSFCSIDNLLFVIRELIQNESISPGIYNIADDAPVSTNEVIRIIGNAVDNRPVILKIPKSFIEIVAKIGDKIKLPLNSERLGKLSETFIVSNKKIVNAIGKELPVASKDGLLETFESFERKK